MESDPIGHNVVRFPIERRRLDLATLLSIEPDVLVADALSERYDLEFLPFDSIESGEIEARARIATFDRANPIAFERSIRRMNDQAIALAIGLCRQAREADIRAAAARRQADHARTAIPAACEGLDRLAAAAERMAAMLTLSAIAASHRARGIDAVVCWAMRGDQVATNRTVAHFG
ncbi:hypothetical protein [Acidiphilium sp.]|uniref:hypothetical protein n=1 Tax=Acidiphilium sp. TaxID=527 RepID=UPI003D055EAB